MMKKVKKTDSLIGVIVTACITIALGLVLDCSDIEKYKLIKWDIEKIENDSLTATDITSGMDSTDADGLNEILKLLENDSPANIENDTIIITAEIPLKKPALDQNTEIHSTKKILNKKVTAGQEILDFTEGLINEKDWPYKVIIYQLTESGMQGRQLSEFGCDSVQCLYDLSESGDGYGDFILKLFFLDIDPKSRIWISMEFSIDKGRSVVVSRGSSIIGNWVVW